MKIKMITSALKERFEQMLHLGQKLAAFEISNEGKEDLIRLSIKALDLNQSLIRISSISEDLKKEINDYLIACEEAVFRISCELPEEYCELEENLLDLSTGRFLFMRLLDDTDENFNFN